MIRDLVYYNDPRLRKKCPLVTKMNDEIKALIQDMKDSVIAHQGAGMGGPQMGIMKRMIVICFAKEDDAQGRPVLKAPEVFINPELIEVSEELISLPEGNLSIPGIELYIKRPLSVTMRALNEKGEEVIEKATGWRARVIQHEIDHINGVLFFDHLSDQEQDELSNALSQVEKTHSIAKDDRK